MSNSKSSAWLSSAAAVLMLATTAPAANAAGLAPSGNFVSLRVNNSHSVMGVILSPTKILVPAHAVGGAIASYSILAGASDRTVTSCATCELRAALSIVRHPNYNNTGTYSNDLAIVHVTALTYNANVYASTIPASFSNAVGTQFTQIGFGAGGSNHNKLLTTTVSPWTLSTMAGYAYTPGDFVTQTTDTSIYGMISYYQSGNQVYTKLPDYAAWINAN